MVGLNDGQFINYLMALVFQIFLYIHLLSLTLALPQIYGKMSTAILGIISRHYSIQRLLPIVPSFKSWNFFKILPRSLTYLIAHFWVSCWQYVFLDHDSVLEEILDNIWRLFFFFFLITIRAAPLTSSE